MITVGLCLIYYGVAIFCYQLYGWLGEGEWNSYAVEAAWVAFVGSSNVRYPIIGPVLEWFLTWPLSFTLMMAGLLLLSCVAAVRQYAAVRIRRLRVKWVADHATAAGYAEWNIAKAQSDFERDVLDREKERKAKTF